jgi:hypothetical protein
MTTGWTWANLTDDQLRLMTEAERTLGADYLLVYQPSPQPTDDSVEAQLEDLQPAPLTASQLECLHGLEEQLHTIVVAYTGKQV